MIRGGFRGRRGRAYRKRRTGKKSVHTWRRRRRRRRRRPASLLGDGGRRGTFGDLDPRPQPALVRSLVDMCRSSSPSIHTPALCQLILVRRYLALPKLASTSMFLATSMFCPMWRKISFPSSRLASSVGPWKVNHSAFVSSTTTPWSSNETTRFL